MIFNGKEIIMEKREYYSLLRALSVVLDTTDLRSSEEKNDAMIVLRRLHQDLVLNSFDALYYRDPDESWDEYWGISDEDF